MKLARPALLAVVAAAALVLAGCREPIPADYAQYAGHWRGDGVLLVLMPDGHGNYERVSGGARTRVEGPVHSFDAEGFSIGVGVLSARFRVDEPPHLSRGRWRMTVDEQELVRVEILPTRPPRDSYSL
ncbi:hypothetical protein [Arenimonas donghaensis]|uniref:DUF306 domain-containing protein n=1 Tax=Arenimonas donghaensis DSM 18148 = HO3-R19 TaxID=1121014 RepID=A0A087MF49_9GAMM|nr:hypothetical protein [Arenimonas donghaensis]KFL35502.1 hypothetical protein N788_08475 [Arenimonas donghaensis DSM 18148 = HO3-R19]